MDKTPAGPRRDGPHSGPRSRGPHSGPRSRGPILSATRDLLIEAGYRALTLEAVAARAKVGKATIYRWWSGKETLVADALADTFTVADIPDLGDSRAELAAAARLVLANYTGPGVDVALPALAADCASKPHLLDGLRTRFVHRQKAAVAAVVRRAIARGDARNRHDPDFIHDAWVGTILYRRVFCGADPTERLVDDLVNLILAD